MAPSYANIFMSAFEKQMLSSYHHKPFVYFRYIDDIFMISTEGKDSLKKHCNRQNKHIQFTESEVGTTVPFLMFLSVYKTKNCTQTYTVSPQTNINTYITPAATQNTQKTVCPAASLFVYAVFVQQMNYFHYAQKK